MERDAAEEIKRHFDAVAGDLRSEVRAVADGLVATNERLDLVATNERLDRTAKALDEKIDLTIVRLDRLDEKLDRTLEEVKRHFEVVAEGLRGDIRTVAEGFTATNERLDRFEVRFPDQFGEMESLMRLSFGTLDRRIQALASP